MKLRNLIYTLLICVFALPSFAVSDKDMEQAKVIAAKLYLRWTNNGSGYLDEVSASSMSELESKLKAQEKENLKAFNSVKIPSDYASWDKEHFVQFWSNTFFASPALSADGKRAKDRVKAKVKEIKVSAPSASTPKADENKADENKESAQAETSGGIEDGISIPEPQEVTHQDSEQVSADSLAVLQANEQSMALQDRPEKRKSHTWIYVVILIILVILVVWLMVYAANMMKSQGKEERAFASDDKKSKKEIAALEAENSKLRAEIARLKSEAEGAREESIRLRSEMAELKRMAKEAQSARPAQTTQNASRTQASQPAASKPAPAAQPKIINEIYLGRANAKGQFVRGDRRPNPDHTIYRLDTKDGIVGTFRFAATPEAFELATSNPLQFLAGGCVCENFEESETASSIVTETPGTAILENGCWKVLRKSRIRFE